MRRPVLRWSICRHRPRSDCSATSAALLCASAAPSISQLHTQCSARLSSPSFRCLRESQQAPRLVSSRVVAVRACGSLHGARIHEQAADGDDDGDEADDDFLQAYEDLLVSAMDGEGDGAAADQRTPTQHRDAHQGDAFSSGLSSPISAEPPATDTLIEEALSLLPADGAPLPLTSITPSLDLEAISDHFGSARSFFQLFPHHFTCVQDAATKRWRVSRANRPAADPSPSASPARDAVGPDTAAAVAQQHAALDVAALALEEEWRQLRSSAPASARPPTPTDGQRQAAAHRHDGVQDSSGGQRQVRAPSTPPALSADNAKGADSLDTAAWWPRVAALLPPDGSPLPIAQLRSQLPADILHALRERHCGLARCFTQNYATARESVALSSDATSLLRAPLTEAAAASVPLWKPPVAPTVLRPLRSTGSECGGESGEGVEETAVFVPLSPEYRSIDPHAEEDAWWADVPLDEAEVDLDKDEPPGAEAVAAAAAAAVASHPEGDCVVTGLEEVLYGGLADGTAGGGWEGGAGSVLAGLNVDRLREAPAVPAPQKRKAAADTVSAAAGGEGTRIRRRRPSTPEEWVALHTAMAAAHGWLTPPQMLDYLVECVPTFFIPMEELRISDSLQSLVGPRTTLRTLLCRIYVYYVERSEDKTQIRLAASVQHPQRGVADAHYAQWAPSSEWTVANNAGWTAAGAEAVAEEEKAARPHAKEEQQAAGPLLKASSTTKAFPVMHVRRVIKSSLPGKLSKARAGAGAASPLSSPPPSAASPSFPATMLHAGERPRKSNGSVSSAGQPGSAAATAAGRPLTLLARGAAAVPLASIPMNDVGYPFLALATQPVEAWPWWAQLLCVVPHSSYVPLRELSDRYRLELSGKDEETAWRAAASQSASAASATPSPPHPFPCTLLRSPVSGPRQLRLRPFWLAPGCTADLGCEVLPAELVKHLRPVWTPLSRLLQKLSPATREEVTALAHRRLCRPVGPKSGGGEGEGALLSLLRDCGRCCWVSEDGTKVRRYTATQEMDDDAHLSLSLIYGFCSAQAREPLTVVLARAAAHVQPLFSRCGEADSGARLRETGLIGTLHSAPPAEVHAFVSRHPLWLDVGTAAGVDGLSGVLVRRRASLVALTGKGQ